MRRGKYTTTKNPRTNQNKTKQKKSLLNNKGRSTIISVEPFCFTTAIFISYKISIGREDRSKQTDRQRDKRLNSVRSVFEAVFWLRCRIRLCTAVVDQQFLTGEVALGTRSRFCTLSEHYSFLNYAINLCDAINHSAVEKKTQKKPQQRVCERQRDVRQQTGLENTVAERLSSSPDGCGFKSRDGETPKKTLRAPAAYSGSKSNKSNLK